MILFFLLNTTKLEYIVGKLDTNFNSSISSSNEWNSNKRLGNQGVVLYFNRFILHILSLFCSLQPRIKMQIVIPKDMYVNLTLASRVSLHKTLYVGRRNDHISTFDNAHKEPIGMIDNLMLLGLCILKNGLHTRQ